MDLDENSDIFENYDTERPRFVKRCGNSRKKQHLTRSRQQPRSLRANEREPRNVQQSDEKQQTAGDYNKYSRTETNITEPIDTNYSLNTAIISKFYIVFVVVGLLLLFAFLFYHFVYKGFICPDKSQQTETAKNNATEQRAEV